MLAKLRPPVFQPGTMKHWQSDQLHLVRCAGDSDATFATILGEVNKLGFGYCSFGMRGPLPLASPRALWRSNYPAGWQQRYHECDYVRRDPTVALAGFSDTAVLWSDELFAPCPELRAEAREFGLVHGWAQPRRDAHGVVSLLTCVRGEPPIDEAEVTAKGERLQWLSYLCHEGMLKHWGPRLQRPPEIELSDREVEVLRWSCDGKTSLDMAQIIGVSEATVNFHMRNACTKLGTPNKTAAAVRAAMLGLLW
jgi:LuxR family transcriptional regulator, quorum-sensing system regulator SolR